MSTKLGGDCPDPDSRIVNDVKEVADNAATIFCELLYTLTAGTFFVVKIWRLYGAGLALAPYIYLWIGQVIIQVVAPFNFSKGHGAIKAQWSKYVELHDQLVNNQEAVAALKVPSNAHGRL